MRGAQQTRNTPRTKANKRVLTSLCPFPKHRTCCARSCWWTVASLFWAWLPGSPGGVCVSRAHQKSTASGSSSGGGVSLDFGRAVEWMGTLNEYYGALHLSVDAYEYLFYSGLKFFTRVCCLSSPCKSEKKGMVMSCRWTSNTYYSVVHRTSYQVRTNHIHTCFHCVPKCYDVSILTRMNKVILIFPT